MYKSFSRAVEFTLLITTHSKKYRLYLGTRAQAHRNIKSNKSILK